MVFELLREFLGTSLAFLFLLIHSIFFEGYSRSFLLHNLCMACDLESLCPIFRGILASKKLHQAAYLSVVKATLAVVCACWCLVTPIYCTAHTVHVLKALGATHQGWLQLW